MNIRDLLPDLGQLTQVKDVESTLLKRKRAGNSAGIVAALAAGLQIALVFSNQEYLDRLGRVIYSLVRFRFDELAAIDVGGYEAIGWIVVFLSAVTYFVLRRTRLLLRESREPFRYTFWIQPFTLLSETPKDRCKLEGADRFHLLHHDLAERLAQRIQRFSILEEAGDGEADTGKSVWLGRSSSHIQVSGSVAVREESDGDWVLHVMPLIRMGPSSSPATLAPSVKYPLACSAAATPAPAPSNGESKVDMPALVLTADEYNQMVERVYSRVATEVYAQIELDVRNKIELFPTAYTRAVALYHEAEDFARSNTIDAYDRAIALYREALRYFQLMPAKSLQTFKLYIPLWWRRAIGFQHQRARVVTGYAKCLVYKNRMSTLAGRDSNPLYELPELLEPVAKNVELIHCKLGRTRDESQLNFLLADVLYPQDSWLKRRLGHSYTPRFEAQKRTQFELYIVEALVHFFLGSRKRANLLLERAQSTAADMVARDPLYLLARGLVEPVSEKAIPYLRQAVDKEPNFQMAQWFLALAYEKEFRVRDEIEGKRALSVINEYAEVLRINYGNIAALAAQGHLLWLISDPEAKRKFEEGREIKAIARETFVGQLNYCLARIAAEKGDFDECRNRYTEAVSADPTLGAHVPIAGSRGYRSDYDDIGPEMLNRFRRYKDGVEKSLERLRSNASENGNRPRFTEKTIGVVHGFVLNDYANACLRYFHHHGDHEQLQRAISAYEKATRVNPTDAIPWFNLQNAYGWENAYEKAASCFPRARELAPTWSRVAIDAARDRVVTTMVEIRKEEAKSAEADERMQDLDQELFDLEKELAELPRVDLDSRSGRVQTIGAGTPVALQGQVGSDPLAEQQTAVSELTEKIQRLKRGQGVARKEVAAAKRRLEELGKQFEEGMSFALKELRENSRLAALFEGSLNEQIDRVVSIPWRKLDSNDVETLIALAEVLAGGGVERPLHLAATQRLAEHLLKMYAEDHRVLGLLRDVVPKLIDSLEKQIDDPSKETDFSLRDARRRLKHLRELLEDANGRWKTQVDYWMQTDEGTFLALYWYVDQDVDMQALDKVRDQYFKRQDDVFENLLGHVYFRLFRFKEAVEAYGKAVNRNQTKASYHFNRGRSLNALGDSEGALSAFYRAHRLGPEQKEYSENLASAYNQLANNHYSNANYPDAIDNYLRAISLQSDVDFYHSNLALAWERNKEVPENIGLTKAIEAMERASQLAPHEIQHQKDLKRLQTRETMVELYGQSEMAKRVTGVTQLVIDFASDLSNVILGDDGTDLHPSVTKRITTMREKFKKTFGVDLPPSTWRRDDGNLQSGTYIISIDEVPLYLSRVPVGKKLCLDVDELARLGIASEPALPAHGAGAWLLEADCITATDAGLKLLDPLDAMLLHLSDVMRGHMADLIGHSEVREVLAKNEEPNVAALATSPDAVNTLTIVLQGLLAEGVSIAPIEDICDYFVEAFGNKSIREMVEDLRKHKQLNEKLPGNSARTVLMPLGKALEKTLTDSLVSTDSLQILAISPEDCQEALAAVRSAVSGEEQAALVVTDSVLRNPLRKLVELEFPRLPVLARDELLPGLSSNPNRAVELN